MILRSGYTTKPVVKVVQISQGNTEDKIVTAKYINDTYCEGKAKTIQFLGWAIETENYSGGSNNDEPVSITVFDRSYEVRANDNRQLDAQIKPPVNSAYGLILPATADFITFGIIRKAENNGSTYVIPGRIYLKFRYTV